jgi:hypothetical protein
MSSILFGNFEEKINQYIFLLGAGGETLLTLI